MVLQEDWATSYKGWDICRIDGSTSQESRREQMQTFNNGGESPDACRLFLLSTRAGGLGINLVAAEYVVPILYLDLFSRKRHDLPRLNDLHAHSFGSTVIFFDQDWSECFFLQ